MLFGYGFLLAFHRLVDMGLKSNFKLNAEGWS